MNSSKRQRLGTIPALPKLARPARKGKQIPTRRTHTKKTPSLLDQWEAETLNNRLNKLKSLLQTALQEVESMTRVQQYRETGSLKLRDEVQQFEINLIRSALQASDGHQRRAARLLGVKPSTLQEKRKRYKISLPGNTSTHTTADGRDIDEDQPKTYTRRVGNF